MKLYILPNLFKPCKKLNSSSKIGPNIYLSMKVSLLSKARNHNNILLHHNLKDKQRGSYPLVSITLCWNIWLVLKSQLLSVMTRPSQWYFWCLNQPWWVNIFYLNVPGNDFSKVKGIVLCFFLYVKRFFMFKVCQLICE